MATATKSPKTKAPAPSPEANGKADANYPIQVIDLGNITSNSAQSRGTGALSNLTELGWGLFEKIEADKEPVWTQLLSPDPTIRTQAISLIEENEPTVVATAASMAEQGQLQPVGVVALKDGEYDVVFGMQRSIAMLYNHAKEPSKYPRRVEARIYPAEYGAAKNALKLKLMSYNENERRKPHNIIDRALFYQELRSDFKERDKLTDAQALVKVAQFIDMSVQHVTDHLAMLHPKLKDKRIAIQSGELKLDPALKLLARRKEGKESTEKDESDTRQRARFPSVKSMTNAYTNGKKPQLLNDKAWELVKTSEEVRKFIAFTLGIKYVPYTVPSKSTESDTTPAKKGKKLYRMPRATANKLLICLGQTNAATWPDETCKAKLEGISTLGEPGMKLEDVNAQKWFDALLKAGDGKYTVEIVTKK